MIAAHLVTVGLIAIAIILGLLTSVINSPWVLFLVTPFFLVILALKDFRIAIVVLVIIGSIGQSRLLPSFSGFNVFNYLVLGGAVGFCANWFLTRPPIVWPPRALLLLLVPMSLGLLNGISNLSSLPPGAELVSGSASEIRAIDYMKILYARPLLYVFLALLIANSIRASKDVDRWLIPIVISAFVPALVVIGTIVIFDLGLDALKSNWGLLGSIGLHKNSLGGILALGLAPILFAITVTRRAGVRLVLWGLACTVVIALFLTFSRGGVMAAAVVWLLFCLHQKRYAWLILSGLIIPLALILAPAEIVERLTLGVGDSESGIGSQRADDELSAGRFWIWMQLLPEIAKRPFIGAGLSGHMWSDLALSGTAIYPHNLTLSTLIDLGIPAAISVFTFYILITVGFFRLSRLDSVSPTVRALGASGWIMMLAYFVFGLTNSDYIPGKEQTPIWIMLGVLFRYWGSVFPVKKVQVWSSSHAQPIA